MKKLFRYAIYLFACIGFILTFGFLAIKYGLTNEKGVIDEQRQAFLSSKEDYPWSHIEEWKVLKEALAKDKEAISKAGNASGISPRLIASQVAVEQLRLFTTNRELFKTVFAPLKILGVQSQFSWGVVGIKQETAIEVEEYLKNPSSSFYPGKKYEHLLDFTSRNSDEERFMRIINENDRYYSYLYAGLLLKELETQWNKAGYDIAGKPDILSTLFNIGFKYSKPNANPKSGGASIPIEGKDYSFGSLAGELYNSQELKDIFPK